MPLGQHLSVLHSPDSSPPCLLLSQPLWFRTLERTPSRPLGRRSRKGRWERGNIPLLPHSTVKGVYFSAPAVLSALMRGEAGGGGGGERRLPAPWLLASPKVAAAATGFNVLAAQTAGLLGRRSQPGRWSGLKAL